MRASGTKQLAEMASVHAATLPLLTDEQVSVLKRFVRLGATLGEVRQSLGDVFRFDFTSEPRTSEGHFRIQEPGVLVRRSDVVHAMENRRAAKVSELDLMNWATMILHNKAFEIDPNEEDFISEALNDLSFNRNPSNREQRQGEDRDSSGR